MYFVQYFKPIIKMDRLSFPIGYSYYTNNQLAIASSTSFTVVRKLYFTAVLCDHIIVLYVFLYMMQLFMSQFSFHFQTKDSDAHVYVPYVDLRAPNDGDRNSKQPTFLTSFITDFYVA